MGTLVAGLVLELAVALTLVLTTVVALGLDGLTDGKRAHQARSASAGRVVFGQLS
jgi:hypothetical protein